MAKRCAGTYPFVPIRPHAASTTTVPNRSRKAVHVQRRRTLDGSNTYQNAGKRMAPCLPSRRIKRRHRRSARRTIGAPDTTCRQFYIKASSPRLWCNRAPSVLRLIGITLGDDHAHIPCPALRFLRSSPLPDRMHRNAAYGRACHVLARCEKRGVVLPQNQPLRDAKVADLGREVSVPTVEAHGDPPPVRLAVRRHVFRRTRPYRCDPALWPGAARSRCLFLQA